VLPEKVNPQFQTKQRGWAKDETAHVVVLPLNPDIGETVVGTTRNKVADVVASQYLA
jgi:hypothetical protein